jgi:hypothetical protein
MTNQEAECFKCGTAIWVPNYEYVSDRNFCYPCANSYMGIWRIDNAFIGVIANGRTRL